MMKLCLSQKTNISTSSGLVFFEASLSNAVTDSLRLKVEVIESTSSGLEIDDVKSKNIIGFHTHLLGDGEHHVRFTLLDDKAIIDSVEDMIRLEGATDFHQIVRDALIANDTPLIFDGLCDSSFYPYDDESVKAWFDKSDAENHILTLLESEVINEKEAGYLRDFVRQGFVVMEDMIDDELVDKVNAEIDAAISNGYEGYEIGSSHRLEQLHVHYPNMRDLWLDKRYRRMVDLIFNAQSRPCQTLTFVYGSQQPPHQDLIYLTPFPAGYMCGTWIALQDVVENSGELIVYPGSHREKRIYLKNIGCSKVDGESDELDSKIYPMWADTASRYEPFVYRPKKGTVLIWHENLLHSGSIRLDKSLERRSVVIHSFVNGSIVYYDSTGNAGNVASLDDCNI